MAAKNSRGKFKPAVTKMAFTRADAGFTFGGEADLVAKAEAMSREQARDASKAAGQSLSAYRNGGT